MRPRKQISRRLALLAVALATSVAVWQAAAWAACPANLACETPPLECSLTMGVAWACCSTDPVNSYVCCLYGCRNCEYDGEGSCPPFQIGKTFISLYQNRFCHSGCPTPSHEGFCLDLDPLWE